MIIDSQLDRLKAFDEELLQKKEAKLRLKDLGDTPTKVDKWIESHGEIVSRTKKIYLEEKEYEWRLYSGKCPTYTEKVTPTCGVVLDKHQIHYPPQALAKGSWSTVFTGDGSSCAGYPEERLVIKYANNCNPNIDTAEERYRPDTMRDVDTTVMEYIVMDMIKEKGIAPRPFGMSGISVPRSDEDWMKEDRLRGEVVRTLGGRYYTCYNQKSFVRGLVQEKIFEDINRFSGSIDDPKNFLEFVIRAGIETIRHLKALHDIGFIHEDIHGGNIAVKDGEGKEIVLIDFGLAEFFPAQIGTPIDGNEIPPGFNYALLSPWHVMKQRLGRRDDIFRAIQTVAYLLVPKNGIGKMYRLNNHVEIKMKLNFFTHQYLIEGQTLSVCSEYPVPGCAKAMGLLDQALDSIRKVDDVDARPNYEGILDAFQMAHSVIINTDITA